MSSAQTAAAEPFTAQADEGGGYTAVWPVGEVLRDIARGGFAGAIVGILVGGIGSGSAERRGHRRGQQATGIGEDQETAVPAAVGTPCSSPTSRPSRARRR